MVRVGLVGCGTIGTQLALAVQRRYPKTARIIALHDTNRTQALLLQRRLSHHPPILALPALIHRSHVVLEAASAAAAPVVVSQALRARRSVLVMSVGGLLGRRAWQRFSRRIGAKVYLPSGALAGLDGIKAMAVGGRIRRVSLTTRKPPAALAAAPYVRRKGLRLERLTRARVIFEGPAPAVVQAFPQNTNVAAALMLASGVPAARTRIRVIADPSARRNVHELEVEGDCGRIQCRIESRPSANPKTSELAVRSAIATLDRIFDPISIGT